MGDITVIKADQNDFVSKQPDQEHGDVYKPDISFDKLKLIYNKSFLVGGINKKLSTAIDTGFQDTGNDDLNNYLNNLDVGFIGQSLATFGNCFLEKVRNVANTKYINTNKILTNDMLVLANKAGGYRQVVNGKTIEYAEDEIIHIKNGSITNKVYGDSEFKQTVSQLILLHYIDKYYRNYFERGTFGSKVLTDPNQNLTNEQRKTLEEFIKKELNGMSNSSATVIIPAELGTIDLNNELDTKNFLAYRKELIDAVAIGLDIPTDLITPKNSNRSTINVSQTQFFKNLVSSLQDRIAKQLRNGLSDIFENTEEIQFIKPDTTDQEKRANYLSKLVKEGIMTPNEARKELSLEEKNGGDQLRNSGGIQDTIDNVEREVGKFYENLQDNS